IICLDLSEEMSHPKLESFNGLKTNALNISQKMIEMFVRTKHKIDKSHEFALVVVNNDVTWVRLTILVYSRPACQPPAVLTEQMKKMLHCPYFFFDVLYIHNGLEDKEEEIAWKVKPYLASLGVLFIPTSDQPGPV
ncbi:BRISC and BRCA1-A complex member 1-like, partial [Protobothrops mucrosquamatus]|uniref:BRISC and BRCA1-A complex member 1-like n=1 Tax=Protobothrops mucrosquamatus TaxID=103944 RepID=UPI000775F544